MWDSPSPIILFGSESRLILCANHAAAALFCCTPGDMEGKPVESCLAPEEVPRLRANLRVGDPQWGDVGSWHCRTPDGRRFIAHIRYHQEFQGDELVHVVIATAVQHVAARVVPAQFEQFPRYG